MRFYDTEPRWPVRHEIEARACGEGREGDSGVGQVGVFSST